MSKQILAIENPKSRAARCVELASSAKNNETRDYWLKMGKLWQLRTQQAELEAAAEPPQKNSLVVEV